jgi:hypothetical protein
MFLNSYSHDEAETSDDWPISIAFARNQLG